MAKNTAVPIMIISPCGYGIPLPSLDMAAATIKDILQLHGKDAKYISYHYIRGRLTTGENTFESGPLKGWSIHEYSSYTEQRQDLFSRIPSLKYIISNGTIEQENNGIIEKENKRIIEQKSNRIIEKENNRGEYQPNHQPNYGSNYGSNGQIYGQRKKPSLLDNNIWVVNN